MDVTNGKVIECPCGVVLRGPGNDEVIAAAQEHAKANHDMDLTDEQALAMARPA
ncbi:MAG TPA: DUF1059 domain-containing protein [Acidimicrobiales bacterium]|nr:DUF1059 domain-containing protein [Acidimicrobiales bacterium]